MNIKYTTDTGDGIDIHIKEITTEKTLGYRLVPVSSLRYKSLDRGTVSDKYECKIIIAGKESEINDVFNYLVLCKSTYKNDVLYLTDVNTCESPFGLNIEYGANPTAILIDTPKKKQISFKLYQLEFQLRAIDLTFKGTPTIPTALQCVWNGWFGGYEEIGRTIVDTYYNDNFAVIRDYEERKFIGKFVTSNLTDAINLEEMWRTRRGTPLSLDTTDIGVLFPFGSDITLTEYDVILNDLQVEYMSPTHRSYTIEFILQNHLD